MAELYNSAGAKDWTLLFAPMEPTSYRIPLFGYYPDITGGPFLDWDGHGIGVLMARELMYLDYDYCVPVQDFRVPSKDTYYLVDKAIRAILKASLEGIPVYVGCYGGVGRTGLLLSILAKVAGANNPIAHVRKFYSEKAVETPEQETFVRNFKVDHLQRWAKMADHAEKSGQLEYLRI